MSVSCSNISRAEQDNIVNVQNLSTLKYYDRYTFENMSFSSQHSKTYHNTTWHTHAAAASFVSFPFWHQCRRTAATTLPGARVSAGQNIIARSSAGAARVCRCSTPLLSTKPLTEEKEFHDTDRTNIQRRLGHRNAVQGDDEEIDAAHEAFERTCDTDKTSDRINVPKDVTA